jgi:hypothetical protein
MSDLTRRAHIALVLAVSDVFTRPPTTRPRPVHAGRSRTGRASGEAGQTTAEYGMVLLGAAGIALLLVGWATKSGAIGKLFDVVMDNVIGKVK